MLGRITPFRKVDGYDWSGCRLDTGGRYRRDDYPTGKRVISEFSKWKRVEWPDLSLVDFATDAQKSKAYDPDRPMFTNVSEGITERLHADDALWTNA